MTYTSPAMDRQTDRQRDTFNKEKNVPFFVRTDSDMHGHSVRFDDRYSSWFIFYVIHIDMSAHFLIIRLIVIFRFSIVMYSICLWQAQHTVL